MVTSLPSPTAPMTPVQALRRVAFELERTRQNRYKIDAFRKAAGVISAMPADEVAHRSTTGSLRDIDGIGKSTGDVIDDAVAGQVPRYLHELLDHKGGALVDGGADLFAALRGDAHLHSDWSDGSSPIDEMVLTAAELDHEYIVLTDHSPRLKVANGLSAERLRKQLVVIDTINDSVGKQIRLLKGIEVDILDDGSLDQRPELLDLLDLVVASVHSKLAMDRDAMTRRMLAAVSNPRVNVLGHCTGRLVTGNRGIRKPSQFDAKAVFEACAEHNVAVEINSRPERCDPPDDLIALALEIGCLFSIDSDAHAPGQLEMKAYGCARADALGVPVERVITTWDADQLTAWCSSQSTH